MSDSVSGLPGQISITQVGVGPSVTVLPGVPDQPFDVPPFPLDADPSQSWELRIVDGALVWVPVIAPEEFSFTDSAFLVF